MGRSPMLVGGPEGSKRTPGLDYLCCCCRLRKGWSWCGASVGDAAYLLSFCLCFAGISQPEQILGMLIKCYASVAVLLIFTN